MYIEQIATRLSVLLYTDFIGVFYFYTIHCMRTSDGQAMETQQAVEMTADLPSDLREPTEIIADTEEQDSNKLIENQRETLEILLKICGVDNTVDEYFETYGIRELKDTDWNSVFAIWDEIFDLVNHFFKAYYRDTFAYLKMWDQVTSGQVYVYPSEKMELHTQYGKIIIPKIKCWYLEWLFPVSAILSPSELSLYNFASNTRQQSDKDELEKTIVAKLIEYTRPSTDNIVETNNLFTDIEQMCKECGTIYDVRFNSGKLNMKFGWRYGTDTDWVSNNPLRILPPLELSIDLESRRVTSPSWYHPHRLWGNDLCIGAALTTLKDECFRNNDLRGLVKGFIQFWNQWTSSDAQGTNRDPKSCCREYIKSFWGIDFNNLPIKFIDLVAQEWMLPWNDGSVLAYRDKLKEMLAIDSFAKELASKMGETGVKSLINMLYNSDVGIEMVERLFPSQETQWEQTTN